MIRACRELGIETVAVHSEADADSPAPRPGRPDGVHRPGSGRRLLPRHGRDPAGRRADRLPGPPPGLRLPGRERAVRGPRALSSRSPSSGRRRGPLPRMGDKAAARRAMQARRAADDPRHRGDPRRGRRGAARPRARSATRCCSRPPPAAAARGCGAATTRSSSSPPSPRPRSRPRRRSATPGCTSRRSSWAARHIEFQVLADRFGERDPPRRARVLGAAPPPEADRGVAEPGPRRRHLRRGDRAAGGGRRGRHRLTSARDHGVPARRRTARSTSWR